MEAVRLEWQKRLVLASEGARPAGPSPLIAAFMKMLTPVDISGLPEASSESSEVEKFNDFSGKLLR